MNIHHLHDWNPDTDEARAIQKQLRPSITQDGAPENVRLVAGADCSFRRNSDRAYGAVVVYDLAQDEVLEEHTAIEPTPFPYIPGLLSFREMPVLLKCFQQVRNQPDAVIADGHGIAHPRRFGLACHLGLFLEISTIGSAKSVLVGEYDPPAESRGSYQPLLYEDDHVGSVVRSREAVNPIFVSVGHRTSLSKARDIIFRCGRGYKLPEPQRIADQAAARIKNEQ